MTPREIVLEQIHHHTTKPVPYTIYFEEEVEKRLDQHYGDQTWRERLVPYIIACVKIDRRKSEPISDILSRDLYGSIWRTDKRPFHLEEPALKEPTLDGYVFPSAEAFTDPQWKETAEQVRQTYPDSFTIIKLGWGLWETYWELRGFENALTDCIVEPDFFAELLDHLTEIYLKQVALCADIPADAIMFGDDWGEQRGVMIGPDRWRRFFKPRYARIYEATHAQGKLVMSHCCGSVAEIMPDIIEIGMDVLESVQPEAAGMIPYDLKKKWGDQITFWGCLGSQSTIPFGTPDAIYEEVQRLCREMGKGGGYILAPAKPLQPETSIQNAVAVIEAFTNQK